MGHVGVVVVNGGIVGCMVNWMRVSDWRLVCEVKLCGRVRSPASRRKETWNGAIFWDWCLACLPFCVLYALGRLCPALHWFVCRWLAGFQATTAFSLRHWYSFFAFFWLALLQRATWISGIAGGDFSPRRRLLSRHFLMGLHTALRTLGDCLLGIFSSSGLPGLLLIPDGHDGCTGRAALLWA